MTEQSLDGKNHAVVTMPQPHAGGAGDTLPLTLVPTLLALWRQEGRQQWIQTQGTSMLPLIREGDYLLVSFDLATLRRGSVVLFLQNGRLVAHRLLRIIPSSPLQFVTRGDNAWAFDEITTAGDLLGHVLAVRSSDTVIALDTVKWQTIGWLIATVALAVARPYATLRHLKRQLGGQKPLPGVRMLRRAIQITLTSLLRPFVSTRQQSSPHRQGEQVDSIQKQARPEL